MFVVATKEKKCNEILKLKESHIKKAILEQQQKTKKRHCYKLFYYDLVEPMHLIELNKSISIDDHIVSIVTGFHATRMQ